MEVPEMWGPRIDKQLAGYYLGYDAEANIIAGMLIDDELAGNIRVVTKAKDGRPKEEI